MSDINKYQEDGYNRLREFMVDLRSMNKADVLLEIALDMKTNAESLGYEDKVIECHGKSQFWKGVMFASDNLYTTLKAALDGDIDDVS